MHIGRELIRTGIPSIDRQHDEYFARLSGLIQLPEDDHVERSQLAAFLKKRAGAATVGATQAGAQDSAGGGGAQLAHSCKPGPAVLLLHAHSGVVVPSMARAAGCL